MTMPLFLIFYSNLNYEVRNILPEISFAVLIRV